MNANKNSSYSFKYAGNSIKISDVIHKQIDDLGVVGDISIDSSIQLKSTTSFLSYSEKRIHHDLKK